MKLTCDLYSSTLHNFQGLISIPTEPSSMVGGIAAAIVILVVALLIIGVVILMVVR